MKTAGRFAKSDWLDLALSQLGAEGPEAMTVDRLCAAAGRTRGSFYHHFGDHKCFLHEVLEHWQEQYTARIMTSVGESGEESSAALEHLYSLAQGLNFAVEINIRRLAARYPSLQEFVSQVDRKRIGFIEEHYERIEMRVPIEAKLIAELEYAIFIGTQHIDSGLSVSKRDALYKAFSRLLVGRGDG